MSGSLRVATRHLEDLAFRLLLATGLDGAVSRVIAGHLVEAERIGRSTHGLRNLPAYLEDAQAGRLSPRADFTRNDSTDGVLLVDGQNVSGIWAVDTVLTEMMGVAETRAVVTAVLTRLHHTGCMAVYVRRAVERGMILMMCSSNPGTRQAVPHGARTPMLSTNPIAFGAPAEDKPLMLDMATTMVSGSLVKDYRLEGRDLPGPWAADGNGEPTTDSGAAGLMPLGAPEQGYKGTGLALMVEALTQGLGGWGRSTLEGEGRLVVFLQLINPAFFGGEQALERELGHTLEAIRKADPRISGRPVDVPGDRAGRARQANREAVSVSQPTWIALQSCAKRLGVSAPEF